MIWKSNLLLLIFIVFCNSIQFKNNCQDLCESEEQNSLERTCECWCNFKELENVYNDSKVNKNEGFIELERNRVPLDSNFQISLSFAHQKLDIDIDDLITISILDEYKNNFEFRLLFRKNEIQFCESDSNNCVSYDQFPLRNEISISMIANEMNYSVVCQNRTTPFKIPISINSVRINNASKISKLRICSQLQSSTHIAPFEKRQTSCPPTFLPLGTGVNGIVFAISSFQNRIYIGGGFTQAASITTNHIAKWDGITFSSLGDGVANGTNGVVLALATDGNFLYVGGVFEMAASVSANNIVKWDGLNFYAMGNGTYKEGFGDVFAIVIMANSVYIGGYFDFAGWVVANNVAKWDGVSWSALSLGVDDSINSMVSLGGTLYIGGNFLNAGTLSCSFIAKWDGVQWSTVGSGSGFDASVESMVVTGNDLIVVGAFQHVNGMNLSKIAKWDGGQWSGIGSGLDGGIPEFVAVHGGSIYVVGDIYPIGFEPADKIARWNGTNWIGFSEFGYGFNYAPSTLFSTEDGLYIGGDFNIVNGTNGINRIVRLTCRFPPTPQPTPISPTPPTPPTPLPTPVPTPIPTTSEISTTTQTGNNLNSSDASSLLPIVIGVCVGIVLLIAICVVIVIVVLKRRGKSQQTTKNDVSLQEEKAIYSTDQKQFDGHSPYVPVSTVSISNTTQYASTTAVIKINSNYETSQYTTSKALESKNNDGYVSSTTVLQNNAAKLEASELFQKFAIPYDELKIDKQLGKGNFGSVYLAFRKSQLDEPIACKQIFGTIADNTNASTVSDALKMETKAFKDFIAEAKVLQAIPPSNYVVKFIGLCSEPFCILTEFIDGGSLLEYLKNTKSEYTFRIAIGFLKQICKGIAHLHKNGIIHRDLAARNVLLRTKIDEETQVRQCVLVDMGLARLFETGENYLKTRSPIPLKWTAPEALRDKKFSEKSDMYSFGILAIECFTRTTPFPKQTALECAMAISSGKFTPSLKGNCADDLVSILDPCFSLDPDQRPTAQELINQFNNQKSNSKEDILKH